MPYNSKEWERVKHRDNILVGIKKHIKYNTKFMFEINIKSLRKRKFKTYSEHKNILQTVLADYAEFKADIKKGYFIDAKTFEELFKRMLLIKSVSQQWEQLQRSTFKNHIAQHIGYKNIKDIRVYDIDNVMIKVRAKAPATRKSIMDIIKNVMKYAKEEKLIKALPFETRHNIKVNALQQKTLVTNSQDKFIRIHQAIINTFKDNPIICTLFLFGLYGRRKTEILKMKWEQIDFINNQYIIPAIHSKIKTDFVFSLPQEISLSLKQIHGNKRGLIFKNKHTNKEYTNIHKYIKLIRYKSGWNSFTFHSMRNLLSSNLHARGVSASYISSVLGHTNPNTIKQYLTMERTQPIIEQEINKTLYGVENYKDK